jgi:3,4-dihydroxy 2-butanone 4-phosphate synthase/GTP cyclohydrolase II
MTNPFAPIPEILDEIRAGRMIVLVDDEDRENEGDLVMAAEHITPDAINFMATHGRGLICLALTPERCEELKLPLQVPDNTSRFSTAFTVTIDAREGIATGISAADRAVTIQAAIRDGTRPGDLVRPGHVMPLRAREGGVLVRAGQTEGSVDLARLAGLYPAGVICEIVKDDGRMARVPDLVPYCARHGIKMTSVAALIAWRRERECLIQRASSARIPTAWGVFDLHVYVSAIDPEPHLALTLGLPSPVRGKFQTIDEPVLVRVHSECLTGDILGSRRCDCGEQKDAALRAIAEAKRGIFLYMRQEGRGIGLVNKLKAYALQDQGLDTVQANEKLGFRADERDYGIGARILFDLGVQEMRLLTNNPKKYSALEGYGLSIVERVPIQTRPSEDNRAYLRTKMTKLGHMLSEDVLAAEST